MTITSRISSEGKTYLWKSSMASFNTSIPLWGSCASIKSIALWNCSSHALNFMRFSVNDTFLLQRGHFIVSLVMGNVKLNVHLPLGHLEPAEVKNYLWRKILCVYLIFLGTLSMPVSNDGQSCLQASQLQVNQYRPDNDFCLFANVLLMKTGP